MLVAQMLAPKTGGASGVYLNFIEGVSPDLVLHMLCCVKGFTVNQLIPLIHCTSPLKMISASRVSSCFLFFSHGIHVQLLVFVLCQCHVLVILPNLAFLLIC